jgi:hypothetical protein
VRLFDPLSRRVLMDVPTTDLLAMSCSGRVALSRRVPGRYELDIYTRRHDRGEEGVAVARRGVTLRRYPFSDFAWSPEGRWLLFVPNTASPAYTTHPGSLWRVGVNGRRPDAYLTPGSGRSMNPPTGHQTASASPSSDSRGMRRTNPLATKISS